ncbi:MAG: response regulator [Pseudomonadota bacterium]
MRQIDVIKLYAQMRCLVVEDMPDVRVAVAAMLRIFGATKIDVVANGEQAIEACNSAQYHMVLCDYNLGSGSDGQQILEELRFRNRLKNTSIFVMITAESSSEMVLGALEYQPDDYITKPITQALLRQRLDRVLLRHQDLYSIKQAMDERDYATAEKRCQERLDDNTSYRSACLQIQAEMNLRLLNFNRAEEIYTGVLNERPVLWAKLGLGKTQVAKKEYEKAEKNLIEVITADKRVVEAHDLLADSYNKRGDTIKAQKAMQDAVDIAPKSIFRLRRLAAVAKLNDDTEACLGATRLVIKTARNSYHESAEDYFKLARELNDLTTEQGTMTNALAKETFEVLQRLEKRPCYDAGAKVQANSLKSRSLVNQNKLAEAEIYLDKAKEIYEDKKDLLSPEAGLEIAQTLIAKGDKDGANKLLQELVEKFSGDELFVTKVDALTDTPISQAGCEKVAKITKSGIDSYDKKKFTEAIGIFKNAISIFPSHIGLNLNLIQAVISEIKENGSQPGFEKICRKSLERISTIEVTNPQYDRYKYLLNQVDAVAFNS